MFSFGKPETNFYSNGRVDSMFLFHEKPAADMNPGQLLSTYLQSSKINLSLNPECASSGRNKRMPQHMNQSH